MVRDIVTDPLFLARPSAKATEADLPICQDLRDTLLHNRDHCVGMAANMIGVSKCIIIVDLEKEFQVLLNPIIIEKKGAYQIYEGCLSLQGMRSVTRYSKIKVSYQDEAFRPHFKTYEGFAAQIVQHEVDHLSGILI